MPSILVETAYAAVVHSADGVRFLASAADTIMLTRQLADYVSSRCDDTLWPADACEVRGLITEGKLDEAIAKYFANVGDRWDVERLDRY